MVTKLVEERIEAGFYRMVWKGTDKPSGLYICRMEAAEYARNIKIVLTK
ncbi:MAG: hypothetical protein P9X24_10705 [Candidatus Hatepunaea meridiana]|nr:hypothetical protein [Candidatus Hatepunaea meridiana]